MSIWSEQYASTEERLESLEHELEGRRAVVLRGGPYDRWDLEVREGASGVARLRMCVENHGDGRQLVHFRVWPWAHGLRLNSLLVGVPGLLAPMALMDGAWLTAGALGLAGAFCFLRLCRQCGVAMSFVLRKLRATCGEDSLLLAERRPPWHRLQALARHLEKVT